MESESQNPSHGIRVMAVTIPSHPGHGPGPSRFPQSSPGSAREKAGPGPRERAGPRTARESGPIGVNTAQQVTVWDIVGMCECVFSSPNASNVLLPRSLAHADPLVGQTRASHFACKFVMQTSHAGSLCMRRHCYSSDGVGSDWSAFGLGWSREQGRAEERTLNRDSLVGSSDLDCFQFLHPEIVNYLDHYQGRRIRAQGQMEWVQEKKEREPQNAHSNSKDWCSKNLSPM